MSMGLINRAWRAAGRRNIPAILASAALLGTYALALSREGKNAAALRSAREKALVATRARTPKLTGWIFWKQVLYRTYQEINDDRLLALAAGVVFYGLLALFPAVTALVSSYALFSDASTIGDHLAKIAGLMPESA